MQCGHNGAQFPSDKEIKYLQGFIFVCFGFCLDFFFFLRFEYLFIVHTYYSYVQDWVQKIVLLDAVYQ